jgi:Domain of unknown function (DUF4193)
MTEADPEDLDAFPDEDDAEADAEPADGEWDDADFDGDPDIEDELDTDVEAGDGDGVAAGVAVGEDDDDDAEEGPDEALDELEAEELEMLTDDEESETLIVDEAAELRAIRRAELAMEGDAGTERGLDEFVCSNCFLVLKRSQLANPRQMLCRDCAA